MSTTDRIEKVIQIRAPKARVWQALTTASEFGAWFRVELEGEFRAGAPIRGRITHPGFEHVVMEMQVERIEPQSLFSYRWHPYAVDPKVDYRAEPTTLVELFLEDRDGGTQLRVVESGFDQIPAGRRDEAFRMNSGGWAAQLENISRHVSG